MMSQIYTSRKVILELMGKQGYNVNDYAHFSVNEVNAMHQNNQLDMLLETSDENTTEEAPKKKIYIRYCLVSKPNVKNIQEIVDDLFVLSETLTKKDTLFVIINDDPNDTLLEFITHIWENERIFIVLESIKRLQFNILQHTLVPPHTVMTESQVKQIMDKYNITDVAQFPEISRFDPVAKVIGLRPGQVCHIVRPSKTSIETNYYRICVTK